MLFGEKGLLQRGKSPMLFLFLPHQTGFGVWGGSGGWMSVGTEYIGWHKGFLYADTTGKPV